MDIKKIVDNVWGFTDYITKLWIFGCLYIWFLGVGLTSLIVLTGQPVTPELYQIGYLIGIATLNCPVFTILLLSGDYIYDKNNSYIKKIFRR